MPRPTPSPALQPITAPLLPAAGGRWAAVTADPTSAPAGVRACTPELAAWLISEGLAVAVAAEAGPYRQLLHLPRARRARPAGATVRALCPRTSSSSRLSKETPMPTTTRTAAGREAAELLTPGEVGRLFRVDPKTVTRWAKTGRLASVRTLGGHRRYPADQPAIRQARGDHAHAAALAG